MQPSLPMSDHAEASRWRRKLIRGASRQSLIANLVLPVHAEALDAVGEDIERIVAKPGPASTSTASPGSSLSGDSDECASPKFQFIPGMLSEEEIHGIQNFANQHLGIDESSAYFMRRKKAIAFVFVLHGKVYSLEQNYFVQHESYNDFSGGIRRQFAKISDSILQNELHKVVLRFAEHNGIPDKAIMLIQIQTSEVDRSEEGEFRRQLSITGQGIHTDGHEKAMLVCVRRQNVMGAMNQYYEDLDGKQPLCEPCVLQEGDASFFTDNELYHYVSPAGPAVPTEDMARTMVLMHYPAEEALTGTASPKNTRGTRRSLIKLREDGKDALTYPKL